MADGPVHLATTGQRGTDLTGEMAERIFEVIHDYDGRISLPAAVGVLEICKANLLEQD